MDFLTDIEIAKQTKLEDIQTIAAKIGVPYDQIEPYGHDKAKISLDFLKQVETKENGKLILVTAISPTPAGEGKTTISVGLADALNQSGHSAILCLREPSLGPVFGLKGGAAGGGYAQVVPMESINLHFNGDFHAITSAHNLLAALLDNHIHQGNDLSIDSRSIVWKRVIDMNDRQLRSIVDGLGGKFNGVPREDGFDITVASEIMAILCLAQDLTDLKQRIGRIIVAYNDEGQAITASDLKAEGAMTALLKDAIKPNLVQSLEHTPTFVHGGPFANIAHGCNTVLATQTALKCADYTVTEAGFGADLGAEKFLNIKCQIAGLKANVVVLVATIKALKMHGGVKKNQLKQEDVAAVEKGLDNLNRHIDNIRELYGLPLVVTLNHFYQDTEAEIEVVRQNCEEKNVPFTVSKVWEKGGQGGLDLANTVVQLAEEENTFDFLYDLNDSIENKLRTIAQKVYHAKDIKLTAKARRQIQELENLTYDNFPICMAKTPYSFSDNASLINAPEDFIINIRELKVNAGAGFIVALAGNVMTMPGLPKNPAAEKIDIDKDGKITGLF